MANECKCDLRTKLVGDGCEVCNPEYAKQFECRHDTDDPKCTLTSDGYCLMCGEMH